jgi:phosphoribosylaminoimidazole-succinocarboxamide synthase
VSDGLVRSDLSLDLVHRGKVRDVYAVGDARLLMVASDRVSAFDVVLGEPVPRKGEVLTQLTAWWLARLERALGVRHHLLAVDPEHIVELHPELAPERAVWEGRGMLVRRTDPIPVECVVRGFLSGSAWREYHDAGTLAGEPLAPGLVESQELDRPLFSPATKAVEGHDENITVARMRAEVGDETAERLRQLSLEIYAHGRETCRSRGILLADTKFEFGALADGSLLLIDEVMTPDSSRFWPAETYAPGRAQPSLDKQPVRDFLAGVDGWNKAPPPPPLPPEVTRATTGRYLEVFHRLTGVELDRWRPPRFEVAAP